MEHSWHLTNIDTDIVQAFKFCFLTLRIFSGLSLKTWMHTQGLCDQMSAIASLGVLHN
jgi:hypothetical protein